MRSYVEMLTELKETILSDTAMPQKDQVKILNAVNKLFNLLWKYSD